MILSGQKEMSLHCQFQNTAEIMPYSSSDLSPFNVATQEDFYILWTSAESIIDKTQHVI